MFKLNSFRLEKTPFQKGIAAQETNQEVIKIVSLVENGVSKCVQSPKIKRSNIYFTRTASFFLKL